MYTHVSADTHIGVKVPACTHVKPVVSQCRKAGELVMIQMCVFTSLLFWSPDKRLVGVKEWDRPGDRHMTITLLHTVVVKYMWSDCV